MLLKGANILNGKFEWEQADLLIRDGKISAVGRDLPRDPVTLNAAGMRLIPGLIDTHIHGCAGADVTDASRDGLIRMSKYLAGSGTTSFVPTVAAGPAEQMERSAAMAAECASSCPGARILGVHLEGPMLSPQRCGALDASVFAAPDVALLQRIDAAANGMVKTVTLAPELEGAINVISAVSDRMHVSIGHTTADYETALAAFQAGASQATHLYNAMTGISHRAPGVPGAVFDSPERPMAELICDLIHVHPAVVRMTFRQLGNDRVILISDCIRAAGMPDGNYELGGAMTVVKNGEARTPQGNLAGSTVMLMDCVRRLVRCGLRLEHAVRAASLNPARALGMERELGSLEVGKRADVVALDAQLQVKLVVIGGKIFNRGLMPRTAPQDGSGR